MAYHHLALAARNMQEIHAFYEGVMGLELVKVEIGPLPDGGWGKHFFYRMDGNDSCFIAFWELHDAPQQALHEFDLNKAAKLPRGTNHVAFTAASRDELTLWRGRWNDAGLDVLEIDHNWCHSVYTFDPNGNFVEFCYTNGAFTAQDRERALLALEESECKPSTPPAFRKHWPAAKPKPKSKSKPKHK